MSHVLTNKGVWEIPVKQANSPHLHSAPFFFFKVFKEALTCRTSSESFQASEGAITTSSDMLAILEQLTRMGFQENQIIRAIDANQVSDAPPPHASENVQRFWTHPVVSYKIRPSVCNAKFSYFLPLDFLAFLHQASVWV